MKPINLLALGALTLSACQNTPASQATEENENELYLLVGSANPADEEAIKVYTFDQEAGTVTPVSGAKGVANPTFLCTNQAENTVYAVGEADEPEKATLNALHFNKEEGTLELFSTQQNGAGAPCNIILTPQEDRLLCANYWGGSMTIFPLSADGSLQEPSVIQYEGSGPHPNQTQAHVHAVNFTPDHKYVLANDLGLDCIHVYPATFPLENGYEVKVDAGAGPRHLCWAPDGKHAYLICELGGQIYTLSYLDEKLEVMGSVQADTLQGGGSADIHITQDGKFLYASHRLKGDGISIWKVQADGSLERVGYQPTGIHPRNFALTPNDKFLLVACRDTHEIQVFERDAETGLLKDTGTKITLNKPMFVKFLSK